MSLSRTLAALSLVLVSCGEGVVSRSDVPDAAVPSEGGSLVDAGTVDASPPPLEANIARALSCSEPAGVNGQAKSGEMQVHVVDTSRFPDALCNDGSPPILYYRPFRGAANRNRWLISLRGGGGCGSAAACAARWCACSDSNPCAYEPNRTIFTSNNMSGSGRRGESGGGIDARDPAHPGPFDDYNQIQFHYCSSDGWRGNARGVEFTTTHPRRGDTVSYVMHFLGAQILDANLATLQQEGVPPLVYTLSGASSAMPDLDDSTEVVIAGDSGGGTGVIQRLDAMAERLRAGHVGASKPDIVGLIDAVAGPHQEPLDFTRSSYAALGYKTYPEIMAVLASAPANRDARTDQSCLAYHSARGTAGYCLDETHVLRHHITTPFFYRMALLDEQISGSYVNDDIRAPSRGGESFKDNIRLFGLVLHDELSGFGSLKTSAEEGPEITVAPGVFAPACGYHDTIHETAKTFGTTIKAAGQAARTVLDVYATWRTTPASRDSVLLTEDPTRADTVCP